VTGNRPRGRFAARRTAGAGAHRPRPGLRRINETPAVMPGQTRIASATSGNFA